MPQIKTKSLFWNVGDNSRKIVSTIFLELSPTFQNRIVSLEFRSSLVSIC